MGLLTGKVSLGAQNLFEGPMKIDQYPGTAFAGWEAPETLGSGLLDTTKTTTGNGKTCATHGGENKCGTWPNCIKCESTCLERGLCADCSQPPCTGTAKTCATHGGANKCGTYPNCHTCIGSCDPGYIRNASGQCVPEEPTNGECTAAGCAAKYGGSPAQWMCVNGQCQKRESEPDCYNNDQCPEGQRCVHGKCQGGVTLGCNPGEIWAGGECWCPDGSKPPCGGGDPCPDPNTHWDSFTGRCLPNKQDYEVCRWGRNPHTDQCNPNPNSILTVADVGSVRTTDTGGVNTSTGLNTGDYRLDYSPGGAEDRGQDYPAKWVDTAAEKSVNQKADDTAARAVADQKKANDAKAAADRQAAIAAKSQASDDRKAAAAAQRRADKARIAAAAAASRAAEADRLKAEQERAAQQRREAAEAMAAHWAWMEQEKERRAAEEAKRLSTMYAASGILSGGCPPGQAKDAFGNCISASNIWS